MIGRRSRRSLAALAIVAVMLPSAAGIARGAAVTFGTPEALATYGTSIEFSVPLTAGTAVRRVELRLAFPRALGPSIIDVPAPAGGATQTLRYTLDLTGGASLVPNTPIGATWAIVTADGETVTSREITVLYADTDHEWRTLTGDLMTVHWYAGPQSFAERELKIGEKALRDANALLGVTDTTPVDFFVYGDQASFAAALGPGTRENQIGQAHADIRTMFGLVSPDTLDDPQVAAAVPHELVHLVFDTAVRNPYRFPPHWLDEGLAVYLTEGYSTQRRSLVEAAVRSRNLIPLDAIGGRFPADAERGFLAYCEAASAIDHLVRTFRREALVALVRAYKDGLTDDEAFTGAVGLDLAAFQAGWLKELGADPPKRYGPQPAPAGPLPPGWSGPGQSAGPGTTDAPPAVRTGAPTTGPDRTPSPSTAPTGDRGARGQVVLSLTALIVVVAAGLLVAHRRRRPR